MSQEEHDHTMYGVGVEYDKPSTPAAIARKAKGWVFHRQAPAVCVRGDGKDDKGRSLSDPDCGKP